MKTKINIAEILKNKPQDIKLYSPIFGDCTFCYIKNETNDIRVKSLYGEIRFFNFEGLYNTGGECLLFPSKEMRDWNKFTWKKGDVLVSHDGKIKVIFEKFRNDTYQSFIGRHHLDVIDENLHYQDGGEYPTFNFNIETGDAAQTYINTIEEKFEGKFNRETLEIEKTQPVYGFKPMDLCLMKYIGKYNNRGWELCQYAYTEHRVSSSGEQRDFYHAVGGEIYAECIPYKGNEHLLGTTNSPE